MEPRPGDFFVVRTRGFFGFLIRLFTRSDINHAGIYLGDNQTMEAMPLGAEILTLRKGMVFSNDYPTTAAERAEIVKVARTLEHRPYGFSDVFALSAATMGIKSKWLAAKIGGTDRLICSQLADYCYSQAGVHLFDDDRMPQNVTPEDLAEILLKRNWEGQLSYNGKPVEVDATVPVKYSPHPLQNPKS